MCLDRSHQPGELQAVNQEEKREKAGVMKSSGQEEGEP